MPLTVVILIAIFTLLISFLIASRAYTGRKTNPLIAFLPVLCSFALLLGIVFYDSGAEMDSDELQQEITGKEVTMTQDEDLIINYLNTSEEEVLVESAGGVGSRGMDYIVTHKGKIFSCCNKREQNN